jgi:hypothetical protein
VGGHEVGNEGEEEGIQVTSRKIRELETAGKTKTWVDR